MRQAAAVVPVVLALLSTACSGGMSVEEARRADVVAVNGVTLDGATLEQLLLATPAQLPPSSEAAAVYVSAFIDAALLRRAMVRGMPLADSTVVEQVIMPDAVRGQILSLLQQRESAMPVVTDEQADSLARLGSVRVFQHVLFRIANPDDSLAVDAALQRVEGVLRELREGTSFADIARRVSEDTNTAAGGGYLPPLTRRELPQGRFADIAWGLQPGEVSQVVGSPAGVHLLRRASMGDARPGLKAWLAPRLARRADSVWADSLTRARNLALADDATARLREMALEPFSGGGDTPLATWEGGNLSADEVRSWIGAMPSVERAGLPVASDSAVRLLLRQLAEREVVWELASPDGRRVTPEAWEALAPQYRQILTAILEQYRDALTVGDSSAAVRGFVSDITAGRLPYRPLPGALGSVLRRDAVVTVNEDVIAAIVASASRQWQTRTDSAAAAP